MNPELHALVGPYVLDALDDAERHLFEEHLERCPACRDDVAELGSVPAALARSVAEPVPTDLRARVLAEVDVTRQERHGTTTARRRRLRRGAALIATAAALIAVAVGVASWQDATGRADEAETFLAVMTATDARRAAFDSEIGRLEVATSPSHGLTVIVGHDVPAPPEGRTYELWFIGDDGPEPAGTFRPTHGQVRHKVDGIAPDALGITVEPAGGSEQPTGAVLASADL